MKIKEIKAKSIITKSGLPDSDFVINPYIGCLHGCIYCYARFMKRFTNHTEPWGQFLDVKINAPDLIPKKREEIIKYRKKSITISSVTDPYQLAERKYKLTRAILERLLPFESSLCIITKSDLIIRDIDLLKRFKNLIAGVSLSFLDDNIRREIEPLASSVEKRIHTVKKLKEAGIPNFIFISPIFPELTDWRGIVLQAKDFVDEFWFEDLNVKRANWLTIKRWLKEYNPDLLDKYGQIYFSEQKDWYNMYLNNMEQNIRLFCEDRDVKCKIYLHHKKSFA